jgi:hypothetical protein
MSIETVSYCGWNKCLRLANSSVEAIITTEVGPRIISLKGPNGENVLKNYEAQLGGKGESEWQIRGGHRLWAAPEDANTYALDNDPVEFEVKEDTVVLRNPPVPATGLAKELTITLAKDEPRFFLKHTLVNSGTQPVSVASWALSVMAPGGTAIIPLPPPGKHPEDLLPNRLMVVWPYTDLSDERWKFGKHFITLRQDSTMRATKLGLFHTEKWVAYAVRGALFLKKFAADPKSVYTDMGCNFETFTNEDMLELESLGPFVTLAPGASTSHDEEWYLTSPGDLPANADEATLAAWLCPSLTEAGWEGK